MTTSAPTSPTYEGILFTACPILNVLAINTAPVPPNPSSSTSNHPGDYHIIPVSKIQNFQILSLADGGGFSNAIPAISRIDTKKLQERADARIKKLQDEESKRNKDAGPEAQGIFNALDRMYVGTSILQPPFPQANFCDARSLRWEELLTIGNRYQVRWHGSDIVVSDAVIITAPYTADSCRAPKDKQRALDQIKKVVEGERRKLADKTRASAGGSGSVTPVPPRKGG